MYPVKQSTALTVPVFVHDVAGDAVTGLVDAGFTKRISKNGAAFAAMTVTITEMENGWYSLPISAAHSDTLGVLSVTLIHASAKQVNLQFRVTAKLIDDLNDVAATDIVSAGAITTSAGAVSNVTTVATTTTNTDMRGTDNALLAASAPTNFGDLAITITTGQVTVGTNNDKTGYTASAIGAGAIDAAAIATGAIDADALAADAGTEIADALLNRDMSAVSVTNTRSPINALRFLRNKWSIAGTTLTITEEDDATSAWTSTITTDAAANPITANDPA